MLKLPPMKLGVVGQPSSGKDTVASYLVNKYGFVHFSGGDFFRKYIKEHNLGEPTRPLLQKVANEFREKHGSGYLVEEFLKAKTDHLVISGIRTVGGVETLKKAGGKLIAVDAPIKRRYQRVLERKRTGDQLTFEEFQKQQEAEHKNKSAHAQNVGAVVVLADYVIPNDGTLEDLYKKVDELLAKISKEIS